jgi:Integrase core domain
MSAFKQADRNKTGRHERMHRTLKEDTTKPPAASLRAHQSRFDNFRYVFNNERPHEGLNNQVPARLYHPSSARLPRKLSEFTYPKGLLLRQVNNSGDISWHKNRIFISEVFRFEELAFELITPGFIESPFETWKSENSMWKSFVLELYGEWSEFADECMA